MVAYGYTLSSEEHGPPTWSATPAKAEELGFDFVSISDHYHPWVTAQGHSPFVWSVLGAIAATTERLRVGVGVTCPIIRIHPAIIAQATATTSLLFEGRFFFGVGTGEALNEHILGRPVAAARACGWRCWRRRSRSSASCGRARPSTTGASTTRSRTPGSFDPPRRAAADHRVRLRAQGHRRWPPASATGTGATPPSRS